MDIIISNDSDKPIYEQITSQIKNQIMQGSLREGDALPSMRTLAKELRISVITTKRGHTRNWNGRALLQRLLAKEALLKRQIRGCCEKKI